MKKYSIRDLALIALSIAMVCIGTMAIQIPIPATNGYIHVGDGIILLVGASFGPGFGMLAGGLGSALADIITGYAIWAPFTLFIKGLMGYLFGRIAWGAVRKTKYTGTRTLIGALLSVMLMITGYFLAETLITGSVQVALLSIPWNALQALSAVIIFTVVGHICDRVDFKGKIK